MKTVIAGIVIGLFVNWLVGPIVRACPTEDSTFCYWDAQKRGDGQGQSFYAYPLPFGYNMIVRVIE